ncbi:MAG TPA: chemotaxis protein CheW [Bryobacteraceae bacterium]|jgi:purine-binding chemotaxis protein CheW
MEGMEKAQPGYAGGAEQYLSFALGEEEYGIEILKVQEIKGYSGVTPIPDTPPHIRGVMNLRGTVIPVVDLRMKFSREARPYDKFTVIIVVTVGSKIVGLVVDAVSDVLDISAREIRPTPELGRREDTRFLKGMATIGEKLVVLLDIETLLAEDALAEAQETEKEVEHELV